MGDDGQPDPPGAASSSWSKLSGPGQVTFGDATEPITLVINAQGQITGTYTGTADVASLAQAATKKAGGCCPSTVQGGSKSCGPTKK